MDKRNRLILVAVLLLSAFLFLGSSRIYAEERESGQEQAAEQSQGNGEAQEAAQKVTCDGTARAGSTQGLQRSTSNCDRESAAWRNAARRAAAATGQPSPEEEAAQAQDNGGAQ